MRPAFRARLTGAAGAAVLLAGLAGCGDPEPAASEAPLEVVLDTCMLNRSEIAPGVHEVALVGVGTVTVTDSSGATVLTLTQSGSLTSEADTYTFTCTSGGAATGTATVVSKA